MDNKYLKYIANLLIKHPGVMLFIIMILTLLLGYRASTIPLTLNFDYFLSDNNPKIETFNEILNTFENDTNILLLAHGSEDSLKSFALHIKPLLESFEEWVSSVHTHTPLNFFRKNTIKLMESDELDNFKEIFYDPNLVPFLFNFNNAFEKTYLHFKNGIMSSSDEKNAINLLDRIQMFINTQNQVMQKTETLDVGNQAVDAIFFGEGLTFSPNRDMLLIFIEPSFNMYLSSKKLIWNVNGIEKIIQITSLQHGIKSELAGPLIKARDYYTYFKGEFSNIAIFSLAGCFLLLLLLFRLLSVPLMCIIVLIVSSVWIIGIYSFIIPAMNLIAILVLIGCILFSIGNCILLIMGFLDQQRQGLDIEVSIQKTLQRYGSIIIYSGGIVGLAFLTLVFSEIKVWKDLGILTTVGIITTIVLTVFLLPILFIIKEKLQSKVSSLFRYKKHEKSILGDCAQWIAKNYWIFIIFILCITSIIILKGIQMNIDTNLSYLVPNELESRNTDKKLINAFGLSSSLISFTLDTLETARIITDRARNLMSSGKVESISDYLPEKKINEKKFRYLRELRRIIKLRELRKQLSSHDIKMYRKEIERLEANIIEFQDFSLLNNQLNIYEKTKKLVGDGIDSNIKGVLSPFINALDTGMNRVKLTYFQEQFSKAFKTTVLEMANTEPLIQDNLPLEIKTRFTGIDDNKFRINIYPNRNIWDDITYMDLFKSEASSLSEKISGLPVVIIELKENISNNWLKYCLLMILSILLLILIGFRSVKHTLIIIVSLAFGWVWMMGILTLLDKSLNMINIWIIPIILSISINNYIQILQQWRLEKNLKVVYNTIGNSILISTLTICIMILPFGFANHIGLNSITILLLCGLGCNFFANLIIPSLLLDKLKYLHKITK